MHPYVLAELYPKDKNLKDRWFVQWRIFNVQKNKLVTEQKRVPAKLKTIREREKWAKEYIAKINAMLLEGYVINSLANDKNVLPDVPKLLIDVLGELLAVKSIELKKKSKSAYKSIFGKFKGFLIYEKLGNITTDRFTSKHGFLFKDYLLKECKNQSKTVNKNVFTMGHLFKMGIERGVLTLNPFANFKPMKETETESNTAFLLEHQLIIEHYLKENDIRLYYFTRFLYYAFIRPGELRETKIKDIDFERRTITVFGQLAKNGKTRIVRINPTLWQIINEMGFKGLNPNLYLFGKKLLTTKFVQPTNEGYNRHVKLLDKLELNDLNYTLYSWRHTGAVNAVTVGKMSIFELQKQFGHSDVKETQIYLKTLRVRIDNEPLEKTW